MNIYRVFPEPRQMLPVDEPDSSAVLDEWYQVETAMSCRLSLITTPTGELGGPDGTSQSLSNPADRAILLAQRRQADAVITGAKTVRGEPVPVPAHAPLVILSRSGQLADHQVIPTTMRDQSVMVITGAEVSANPVEFFPPGVAAHHVLSDSHSITALAVLDLLRSLDHHHLLVEGGKEVATLFAGEGLLDELCVSLTGAPRVEQHPPIPWWEPGWGEWTGRQVLTDDLRTLYFRYQPIDDAYSSDSAR